LRALFREVTLTTAPVLPRNHTTLS